MKSKDFADLKKALKRKKAMLLEADRRVDQDIKKEMANRHGDDADLAESDYEQEMSFYFKTRAQDEVRHIDEALTRIEQGEYGICAECGEDIPKKRLDAQPYSIYCVECQERLEARKVAS